jgi:hypothetical protein
MKKFLSISFAMLILLSGMHFTIATHYCGGRNAFTKLSVSGELASCGMEGSAGECSLPVKLSGAHCCKDKVAAFVVDTNYAPAYSQFKVLPQPVLQVFELPFLLSYNPPFFQNLSFTYVRPPGHFSVSDVSLPLICVFRI